MLTLILINTNVTSFLLQDNLHSVTNRAFPVASHGPVTPRRPSVRLSFCHWSLWAFNGTWNPGYAKHLLAMTRQNGTVLLQLLTFCVLFLYSALLWQSHN